MLTYPADHSPLWDRFAAANTVFHVLSSNPSQKADAFYYSVTVTVQIAVCPFLVVAVIVAVPSPIP